MISKFIYKKFKCYEEAELSIEYLTTLIGTNSSGKTNAIEGMMILSEVATGMDLTTVLEGSKSNNGGIRGGGRGCCRKGNDTFTLGCIINYNEKKGRVEFDKEKTFFLQRIRRKIREI